MNLQWENENTATKKNNKSGKTVEKRVEKILLIQKNNQFTINYKKNNKIYNFFDFWDFGNFWKNLGIVVFLKYHTKNEATTGFQLKNVIKYGVLQKNIMYH